MTFHRWVRHEDAEQWVCEAPSEPRGPSYGTDPTLCDGCGAVVTDEMVIRCLGGSMAGLGLQHHLSSTLDIVLAGGVPG